jgi:hypothetical protein
MSGSAELRRKILAVEDKIKELEIHPLEFVTDDERRRRRHEKELLMQQLEVLKEKYERAIRRE